MMRSLYSAVSGLKTHQTRMDVIGNNIANVNTEAFKSSSVTFSEIMYQTLSGATSGNGATGTGGVNAKQVGLGVSTGSTSISIETAGAAETTGNPFDLKLTDSQTTNFFIVSDGNQTMFTRAGSFYVDGNGYLCMSSTGYTLMGWQVDAENPGAIRKDVVSALQVMSPTNQTSQPEATTKAYVSGVLDKNDSNLFTEDGYVLALGFYDDKGYSYTAKYSLKPVELNEGEYTIELTDIIDSKGVSILKDPSDPTGETYKIHPGLLFSTGEKTQVAKEIAQKAADALGVPHDVFNLGTTAVPDLVTIDDDGNLYAVVENGATMTQGDRIYSLLKAQNGDKLYVEPKDINKFDLSHGASQLDASGATVPIMANGKDMFKVVGADGKTRYYIKNDNNELISVTQSPRTKAYISDEEEKVVAKQYQTTYGKAAGVGTTYISETLEFDKLETLMGVKETGTLPEVDQQSGYTFYYNATTGKTYATTGAAGANIVEATRNVDSGASYKVATANVALPPTAQATGDTFGVYTTIYKSGSMYYGTSDGGVTFDQLDQYYKVTYTVPATPTIAYYSAHLDGDADPTHYTYASADKIVGATDSTTTMKFEQVTDAWADGDDVIEVFNGDISLGFYAKEKTTGDLYKVTKQASGQYTYDDTKDPDFVRYANTDNDDVYIQPNVATATAEDLRLDFDKPYTITKYTDTYAPYHVVYDKNDGTFVSCGVDNKAEGTSLTLGLADVMLNRVFNEDGTSSIFTSADGYTTSNFKNITIDFKTSMNYNNSGVSTLKPLKGDTQGDGTGKKLGALTGLTVNSDGKVYGSYDNGNTVLLCQVAVAQFSNASGLEKIGENCYQTTLNSGDFDGIGVAVDADGSSISTGELEMSNVDLSSEFTSMIITQRGFQANSRVITTSDSLLEELINLKR